LPLLSLAASVASSLTLIAMTVALFSSEWHCPLSIIHYPLSIEKKGCPVGTIKERWDSQTLAIMKKNFFCLLFIVWIGYAFLLAVRHSHFQFPIFNFQFSIFNYLSTPIIIVGGVADITFTLDVTVV
jgi:hypothetical protein